MADRVGGGAPPIRGCARGGWWRHALAGLVLLAYLGAGIGGTRALWARWQEARFQYRGVAFGVRPLVAGVSTDPWGINVALEQYPDEEALAASLDLLAAAGFRWVHQRFPWAEIEPAPGDYRWEPWDTIVRQCEARGLTIIAVLDGSPAWARAPEDEANPHAPPLDPEDLATFARAFALRYSAAIDHYQIWDQPNIHPHWGERDVDPGGYLRLLRAARTQVRDVDPSAVLICAGLAPTIEEGGRNLSEVQFLRGLYAAGGRELFDVVAAKPLGFWSGPEDRRVEAGVLNLSRLVALREEMVRHGDGQKPVWAVAWGWNALPPDWEGRPSPWGSDAAWRQHDRTLRAIERVQREWPWLGLMCYAAWQPAAPADDPIWGMALLDAQGQPGALYYRLQALAQERQPLHPGYHALALETADPSTPIEVRFWGSRLDIAARGRWEIVEVDERPVGRVVPAGAGWVTVARGLMAGEHRLLLSPLDPATTLEVRVVREAEALLSLRVAAALAAAALLATALLWYLLRPYPWRGWVVATAGAYRRLSLWAGLGVAGLMLVALAVAPNLATSLVALAVLALAIATRPDVGLMLAVFLVPLAPLLKSFGPARFSYLETVTLLALASQLGRDALSVAGWMRERQQGRVGPGSRPWPWLRQARALDLGLALLVAVSIASLLASENLRVSLRELRVVVLQAAFLYWLVVRCRLGRDGLLHLADVLVLSATVVSLQGLFQYLLTEQVIVAEGVRRVRGIYGSPNNLALVLGRAFPLMLATVLSVLRGPRRWLYGVAAALAALCLFLTFSRGAWFFGAPASLVALAFLAGRRWRIVIAGLAALALVGAVPLLGTARFASLFALEGTSLLRLKLWEAAWEMGWDHPWFGVGLDNFLYQYPRYIRPEAASEPHLSHPHNIALDFWLRLGLPGLLAFGWLQWRFFKEALALWRRPLDPALRALNVGLLAGMASMMAHGLVDASFFVVELAAIYALMVAFVRQMGGLEAI